MQMSQTPVKDQISVPQKNTSVTSTSTVPGNSTYSGITKHDPKICVVGGSHIKRIRRSDFNKELCFGKAFSVSLVAQMLSSYIISFPL